VLATTQHKNTSSCSKTQTLMSIWENIVFFSRQDLIKYKCAIIVYLVTCLIYLWTACSVIALIVLGCHEHSSKHASIHLDQFMFSHPLLLCWVFFAYFCVLLTAAILLTIFIYLDLILLDIFQVSQGVLGCANYTFLYNQMMTLFFFNNVGSSY
jgi:hypothetical protein